MRKILFFTIFFIGKILLGQDTEFPFQDVSKPLDVRIDDLISRLTLEEKAGMMLYNSPAIERLGIPEYNWWNECLHGVARAGKATVFPQAIGMAASFDDSLLYLVASAISDEARAKHNEAVKNGNRSQYTGLSFWSPNINIFRDPRWGRGQETYGEDPYLTGRLGVAFVKGLQGDDTSFLKVSACAKHFAVHSGPEESRHHFNVKPSDTDLNNTYLPAFKMLVDSGVESVMCAYNRVYDEPCCGSKFLLGSLLRKTWGFKGHVVSDCWALDDIWARHKTVKTRVQAAAMALNAGVDLNCGYLFKYLPDAVKKGLVDEKTVDRNLKYLLKTGFKLGLYDKENVNPWSNVSSEVVDSPGHRELAYKMASESIVLLKNNGILPLANAKKIFVTGELATDMQALIGNYNGFSSKMVTVLEGIINKVNPGVVVDYSTGYLLGNDSLFNGFWQAGMADVTIACVGINRLLEGENGDAMLNPYGGDRKYIELPENQVTFLKKLRSSIRKEKNKKLIVVVFGGSAIGLKEIKDLADAILFVWYPGEEGGNAIADILFGKVNPSGKLPVTFYSSTKDLPPFDDYYMKGRTYRYFTGKPLYPFGFGLSYSNFKLEDMAVDKSNYSPTDTISIKVNIRNSGDYSGDEVVQIYASLKKHFEGAPVKTLIDFKRVRVEKHSSKEIELKIPVFRLQLWDQQKKKYVVPKGKYLIMAGNSSEDVSQKQEVIIN